MKSFLLAFALFVFPQSTTSLRGTVTDPTGAVIPQAVVSITNINTGFKRQALTEPDGVYQFLQAPPGMYQLSVEVAGFATHTSDKVQLQVNTPATLDVRMEVGLRLLIVVHIFISFGGRVHVACSEACSHDTPIYYIIYIC